MPTPYESELYHLVDEHISLRKQRIELDPLTVEDIIRSAADNAMAGRHDDRTRAEILLSYWASLFSMKTWTMPACMISW